jgi:hypothetical protein
MTDPKPNYDEAVQFSEDYFGELPRHIVSIVDGQGPIARTFQPDEDDKLRDFIEKQNASGGNIYFAVNEIAETAWNKKATKAGVTRVTALHCDLDDLSDEALSRLVEFNPKPSIILCSGGGYQAFWLLEEPLEVKHEL